MAVAVSSGFLISACLPEASRFAVSMRPLMAPSDRKRPESLREAMRYSLLGRRQSACADPLPGQL